ARQVPLAAIANVFNGPGEAPRARYREVMEAVRASGGRVLGYVHTTYTKRPLEEVSRDIDRWAEFYPLDGIFVDEVTNDGSEESLAYYEALLNHTRRRNARWMLAGNPGTSTRESYLARPTAD